MIEDQKKKKTKPQKKKEHLAHTALFPLTVDSNGQCLSGQSAQ